jgi:hypothetical protein
MQLESIAANVRMRSSWEAIDLGFAMVRAWWLIIYTPLALLLIALITLFLVVIPYEYYWVTLLLLWWLKPLYHRLILEIISRRLFGESIQISEALKKLPHLIFKTGLLSELTWRRLSMSRGFILPIWQLENLRGAARKKRQQILLNNIHGDAVWLTIAIFCFQLILTGSFFMLIWLFIPADYSEDLLSRLFSNELDGIGYTVEIIAVTGFVVVMTFLEPFYIGASFALYINRRTQLEAWDIELDFRKMSQRMKAADNTLNAIPAILFALCLTLGFMDRPAFAESTEQPQQESSQKTNEEKVVIPDDFVAEHRLAAEESKRVITEVMQSKGLNHEEKVMGWRYIDKDVEIPEEKETPEWLKSFSGVVAKILEFTLWILVAAGIIALYVFRKYWLPLLETNANTTKTEQPDILFGMDVRSESLPDDVVASARSLWKSGKPRDALSLLYRSALIQLITQEQLELKHSHTEGDILRLSQQELIATRQQYFQQLTKQWVQIAYAHQQPTEADMSYLLDHWEPDFAKQTRDFAK